MMIVSMSTAHSCQDLEVSAWECMEYYGEKRGAVICRDYYDDFIECTHQNIQVCSSYIKLVFFFRGMAVFFFFYKGENATFCVFLGLLGG